MAEREIAERFRDGDPEAVRELYREYGPLVYAVAFRALGNRDGAEEAVQQTFLQAWRSARSFDAGRAPGPWLATIARRVAIDIHRREARRASARLDDVPQSEATIVTLPPDVERLYEVWEVRRALADLPEDERRLVALQHLQGLSHGEISTRLGIPLGTVKSRSHRAHRRLAAMLGHLRGGPES